MTVGVPGSQEKLMLSRVVPELGCNALKLLDVLRLLELWAPSREHFLLATQAFLCLDRLETSCGQELDIAVACRHASDICGEDLFRQVCGFASRLQAVARGLGTIASCLHCGFSKGLRNVCIHCARPDADVGESLKSQHVTMRSKDTVVCKRFCFRRVASNYSGVSPKLSLKQPSRFLDSRSLRAVTAGLLYLHQCSKDAAIFVEFGGDIMFLMRNIVHTAAIVENCELAFMAARFLHDLILCWMKTATEFQEMDEILNAVEALHVLWQLDIDSIADVPEAAEIVRILSDQARHPKEISCCRNRSSILCDALASMTSDECERHQVCRLDMSIISRGRDRTSSLMKARIATLLNGFDVTDVIGFDPRKHGVPMTHVGHCPNCGKENVVNNQVKSNACCQNCNSTLESHTDYGALTDALVWAYLFEEVGMSLTCHNSTVHLVDVMSLLPQVRCAYKELPELGHDFFRLECYFVTHLIYVASDWGRHSLRQDLFLEELIFLTRNLDEVVRNKDPELAGEFVQCLHILGVTKSNSLTAWNSIQCAMMFLMTVEESLGAKGTWVRNDLRIYDQYHASYCGALGLLAYRFQLESEWSVLPSRGAVPAVGTKTLIPRLFRPNKQVSANCHMYYTKEG